MTDLLEKLERHRKWEEALRKPIRASGEREFEKFIKERKEKEIGLAAMCGKGGFSDEEVLKKVACVMNIMSFCMCSAT